MRDKPAHPDSLRRKTIGAGTQRRDKDEENRGRESKEAELDGVVKPPDEEKQAGYKEPEDGFDLADADGHPAMRQDEHFNDGDKMEEKSEAAEMDAGLPPRDGVIEHRREDGDTSAGIENGRNS